MPVRFVPNPLAPHEIGVADFMVAYLGDQADQIAQEAVSIAPVLTGEYESNIQASSGIEGDSAYGRVSDDTPYAVYLEFGTEDTPTFATLRTALDSHSF